MPLSPSFLVALVLVFGLALGVVLILLGLIWTRIRSWRGDESTRLVDDLARRQTALEALVTRERTGTGTGTETEPARGGGSRRRVDQAPAGRGDGPTLIAVPTLAAGASESSAQAAAAELAERFGAIWGRANAGASAEAIARETGQPVGQVELILALRRQLATLPDATATATASPGGRA